MAYTPPIGIPNPSAEFGWEIDRATPAWPASWLTGPTTATAGFYFIDNTDPAATDSGNPYGHPDLPRETIPYIGNNTLSAGNYVYIHAGTYAPGTMSVSSQGTEADPIWLTGNAVSHPVINSPLHVGDFAGASYWVIENIDMNAPGAIDIRPTGVGMTVDHILVRNCVMLGASLVSDPNGISVGGGVDITNQTTDVVIYNCDIQEYGKYDNVGESEQACVYNDYNRSRTWILNCILKRPGSDCVAGSHSANDTDRLSEYIYVGGCEIECGGENCIDFKSSRYVVVSQNHIYGVAFREQGWLIVLHSGSNPVPVRDASIIFNRIHHGTSGIMGTSTNGTKDIIAIGNLIYDIRASYAPQADPSYNGLAIGFLATQGTGNFIAGNTIYDSDAGIAASNLSASNLIQARSNIFASVTNHSLNVDNLAEAFLDSDYNIFDTAATFFWNNGVRNFAYMQGTAGVELNSLTGDPDFVNAAADNFELLATSPAINAGVEGGGYAAFLAIFGQSIEVDFNGDARPASGVWDIGAYEYGSTPPSEVLNITTLNATTLTVG